MSEGIPPIKNMFRAKRSKRENHSSERHPPHLRGRAIGLFYARRNRERNLSEGRPPRPPKPLGTILLSDNKKHEIQAILNNRTEGDNIKTNTQFHRKFDKVRTGTMEEKLLAEVGFEPNSVIDEELFKEFEERKQTVAYQKMLKFRQKLPSYDKRDDILQLIKNNQVVVISGETGCGKTTQVAQFILDDYLENKKGSICNILCTQPRRISAITVAERVADERAEALGHSIGYMIRVDHKIPRSKGSIVYCTTGIVLKRMEHDPCLLNVSHVILDEIHERDIMSDILITLLKQVTSKRKDLKLILMSATLNAEKFSSYYNHCPHINIPGFTYPVQEFYLEDVLEQTGFMFDPHQKPRRNAVVDLEYVELLKTHIRELKASKTYSPRVCLQLTNPLTEEINLELILSLLVKICLTANTEGAILVFLTGFQEITTLIKLMEKSGKFPNSLYLILPLHSLMPTLNQRKVFDRPPNGVRKIIISTNIAETSITIDDVVFVVDCGKIKMSNYDVETNTSTLQAEWVSIANANQRRGRAGRVQPGICYHLFSKVRNMIMAQYQLPEILRTRIENTILTIKILQLGKAEPFLAQLMDSPSLEVITKSIELLKRIDALDQDEKLTPLGYHLAKLPIAPQMGKMILLGAIFNCTDPVLSVAASLDFKNAFQIPIGKENLVDQKRLELANGGKSDHLLLYEALCQYESKNPREASQFCWNYFLSRQTLNQLKDIKKQLMEYLYDMDFVHSKDPRDERCNTNSYNTSLVKAIICAGLYPNVATIKARKMGNTAHIIESHQNGKIHPKSVLYKEARFESPLIVFYLKLRSTSIYIHDATMVHPLPLIFFGDNYKYNVDENHTTISIGGDQLRFKCSRSTNDIIRKLRNCLNLILEQKVTNPGFVNWQENDNNTAVLRAVMELITSEDTGEIDFEAYDDYD